MVHFVHHQWHAAHLAPSAFGGTGGHAGLQVFDAPQGLILFHHFQHFLHFIQALVLGGQAGRGHGTREGSLLRRAVWERSLAGGWVPYEVI